MSGRGSGPREGLKIGWDLWLARKGRGLTLKQVEEATKIRAGYLAELERENYGVLPAVYVQGYLKTYANFLQLDGEAMVQELKHRQSPPEYPLYVGPPEDEPLEDILAAGGGAAAVESNDPTWDEDPAPRRGGIAGYLYVGSAAFVVLAVVAGLVLGVAGQGGDAVFQQVREPLISHAPETSPPAREDVRQPQREDKGSAGDERGDPQLDDSAGSETKNSEDKEAEPSEGRSFLDPSFQEQPPPAQNSASATASTASAATASASAASGSAVAERESGTSRASAEPTRSTPTSTTEESTAPAPSDEAAAPVDSDAATAPAAGDAAPAPPPGEEPAGAPASSRPATEPADPPSEGSGSAPPEDSDPPPEDSGSAPPEDSGSAPPEGGCPPSESSSSATSSSAPPEGGCPVDVDDGGDDPVQLTGGPFDD